MSSQNLTSLRHQFAGWEQAQEYYVEANLTDGLPIVPPSEDRVRAMLEFAGLPPAYLGHETSKFSAMRVL